MDIAEIDFYETILFDDFDIENPKPALGAV